MGIVLLIYISGLVLQEIGSNVDRYITKIYKGTHQRVLKGKIDKCYAKEHKENFIKNPILLEKYRGTAKELLMENDNIHIRHIDTFIEDIYSTYNLNVPISKVT